MILEGKLKVLELKHEVIIVVIIYIYSSVEVEKNRVKIMKLSELQTEQAMEKQIRLLSNIGTNVQLMYKANMNPFDLSHFLCSNSNQVSNGAVATSRTREININLQPENRTQVLMAYNRGVRNENQVGMKNLTENG
ncbi:uncharacterized protein LOC127741421 isoform X1 [Arachis duranensis]|uniref:Uncharacterized protein LOC127741421 isoform X1 n=1 Tax=Arachis duranensis TaxID=130453 RepID=A0A9C6WH99_ARADU|nr:uncharacterized protein LOC127741421 isoform X1 [Arachis duranensis]